MTVIKQKNIYDENGSKLTHGILATIRFRIFCLLVSYLKTKW